MLGREAVHGPVGLVADHQPLVGIEHAHALRQAGEGHLEAQALPADLLVALLQHPILPLTLLGGLASLAQVADGIGLHAGEAVAERLTGDLDGNGAAGCGLQLGFPALSGAGGVPFGLVLEQLEEYASAQQPAPGPAAELRDQLVGLDDGAVAGNHQRLVVSTDVEGFPDRVQQLLVARRVALRCGLWSGNAKTAKQNCNKLPRARHRPFPEMRASTLCRALLTVSSVGCI